MLLNTFLGVSSVGSGGVSYFFEERFEGTGYENSGSWTEAGTGTVDEDYTGVILEGSQSLRLAGTTQVPQAIAVMPSDQDELWAFFRIQIVVAMSVASRAIFNFRNSVGTAVGGISLGTDNGLLPQNGSTTGSVTVDKLSTGSPYNVWLHWVKGTGADGFTAVAFSASGTEPLSGNGFRSMSNGNSVTDAHDLRVGWTVNSTAELIIDKILISDTATIGDSPA